MGWQATWSNILTSKTIKNRYYVIYEPTPCCCDCCCPPAVGLCAPTTGAAEPGDGMIKRWPTLLWAWGHWKSGAYVSMQRGSISPLESGLGGGCHVWLCSHLCPCPCSHLVMCLGLFVNGDQSDDRPAVAFYVLAIRTLADARAVFVCLQGGKNHKYKLDAPIWHDCVRHAEFWLDSYMWI